ncbi:glycoside hydrolase family 3 N-terminal domain-containing protein [Sphingomonas yantingensis]|uniref:beta-glucosidase n=1 Tax=Sphingomonas yantingensis TaxID=1241761 RepID=A0A7W9EIE3_9SPHN|nr:beta-glucosidase [Sphingomonas yantingensis]
MSIDRRTALGLIAGTAALPHLAHAERARIDDLIARMTIEEKAGQLSCFSDEIRPVGTEFNPKVNRTGTAEQLRAIEAGRIGMLFNGYGVEGARVAQAAALRSRLGIPLIFAADVIHGCRTIFPIPLAEAAAFDPDLSERVARGVAAEMRAAGLHWTFAPMVDVARDQRWGRVAEGAGEDVYLGCQLAAARVRGFASGGILATPKHFAGYAAVRGGMEYGPVDMSERELEAIHLPPFAAAFAAGAAATMAAFTEVDGIPATANRDLLTRRLRERMRFGGVCIADYDADRELVAHGVARDEADAARLAILAGIDMSMQSGLYNAHLPALVAAGAVPIARVDEAVARVLALKIAAGLFDDPHAGLAEPARVPDLRPLAREAATRSIVLLRNEGNLLPLDPSRRIALIGPFVRDREHLNGPWSFAGTNDGVDLATGLARIALHLAVEPGSGIQDPLPGGIERAVAAARAADLVLLAIGEGADMSGEGNSRTEITVPTAQMALAEAVAATGKPIVVLLRHGRALALEGAVAGAPAILATWFLGQTTGDAVADIVFGRAEPTGRLPVSFPFSTGQQPWSYDRPPTGRPARDADPMAAGKAHWRDAPDRARYGFGHGLSFTRFELGAIAVEKSGSETEVAIDVTNIGRRSGTAVLQLYYRSLAGTYVRPRLQLAAIVRRTIDPGVTTRCRFRTTLPPGPLHLWVGEASDRPSPPTDIQQP